MKKPELKPLTSLRFFAAFWVVAYHYLAPALAADPRAPAWLTVLAQTGYAGVPIFFVLSGFILWYTYGDRPLDADGRRRFWGARLARIYPLYLLAFLASIPPKAYGLATHVPGIPSLPAHLLGLALTPTLLQAWVPTTPCTWNCPGWSLSVEAFFYLVFPFLAAAALRRPRVLPWALAAAAAIPVALVGSYAAGHPVVAAQNVLLFNPLVHLASFVLGMLLARHRHLPVLASTRLQPWLLLVACLGFVATIFAVTIAAGRAGIDPYPILNSIALLPWVALLVATLGALGGRLAAGLSHPWLVQLGNASYATYILQSPLSKYLLDVPGLLLKVPVRATYAGFALLAVALVVASLLAHRWVEVPMRGRVLAWLDRSAARGPRPEPVAQPADGPGAP